MDGQTGAKHYRFEFDFETQKRLDKDFRKSQRAVWFQWYLRCFLSAAVFVGSGVFSGYLTFGLDRPDLGIVAALTAIVAVAIYWIKQVSDEQSRANHQFEGYRWDCTIDPDYWTFSDQFGVKTTIPWDALSLTWSHPDAFHASYGIQQIIIYREPLRRAGLEEEFMKRAQFSGAEYV